MQNAGPSKSMTDRIYGFLAIPLLCVAFYLIDHSWTASEYIAFVTSSFDGSENVTADRLEGVDYISMIVRLLLAGLGILGIVIPSRYSWDWRSPLGYFWMAFWGWLFASFVWSVNPGHTAFKLIVLVVFALGAMGISRRLSFDDWNFALATVCCGFVLLGIVAELKLGTFSPLMSEYRFTGTTHPNTQAIYGTFACLVGSLYLGRNSRWTFAAFCFLIIGIGAVILTKSRTSLAGLVLGMVAIQTLRARGAKRMALIAAGLVVVSLGGLVLALMGSKSQGSLGKTLAMGRTDDVTSLTGRTPLWELLLEHVAERPIMGHGYLGFWDAERVEHLADTFKWEIPHGHNIYIDQLLDGGVIGLTLYVLFMISAACVAARSFSRDEVYGVAVLFGMVFVVLLHGVGESLFKLPIFPCFIFYSLIFRCLWVDRVKAKSDQDESDDSASETESSSELLVV